MFAAVYANEEHALFASEGKIGTFQAWEVELYSLNIAVYLANHPTMDLVMKHGSNGVRADGVGEGFRFPVGRAAQIAEGINADNFRVSQFELPHVHVGEPFAEFTDAVEFLLATDSFLVRSQYGSRRWRVEGEGDERKGWNALDLARAQCSKRVWNGDWAGEGVCTQGGTGGEVRALSTP